MIPYEDLVIALQSWRAKQGLPVSQLSGALVPPAQRTPAYGSPAPAPVEDSLDVEDAALLEEQQYDASAEYNYGDTQDGEPAPRPSDQTLEDGPRGTKRGHNDW